MKACSTALPCDRASRRTSVWVVYPDVDTECSPDRQRRRTWHRRLRRTRKGRTGLWPCSALTGSRRCLAEPGDYFYCGEGPLYPGSLGRAAIGGLAHELGHALELPHPPGCDEGLASCDHYSLMHLGYTVLPHPRTCVTTTRPPSVTQPFIKPHDPLIQPPDIPCLTVAGPGSAIQRGRGRASGPNLRSGMDRGVAAGCGRPCVD